MKQHDTYCDFHLGDNLFQMHFLRKLAARYPDDLFFHYAHDCHLEQLREVVEDLERISVLPLSGKPPDALDSWKNAGAGTPEGGFFEKHPNRNDYYRFYVDWFANQAKLLGLEPVIETVDDLLFDYPALEEANELTGTHDVLFVNSQPCSGQFPPMNSDDGKYLSELIGELWTCNDVVLTQTDRHWPEIPCTRDFKLSASAIGAVSLYCHTIVMIGTGPAWPTMNIFNRKMVENRIVLLHPEQVSGFGEQVVNVASVEAAREALVNVGIL